MVPRSMHVMKNRMYRRCVLKRVMRLTPRLHHLFPGKVQPMTTLPFGLRATAAVLTTAMLVAAGCGSDTPSSTSKDAAPAASTTAKAAVKCDTVEANELVYLRQLSNVTITSKAEINKVMGMLATDPKGAISREVELYSSLLNKVRKIDAPAPWADKRAKLLDAINAVRGSVGDLQDAVDANDTAAVNEVAGKMTAKINDYTTAQQAFYADIPRTSKASAAETDPACPKDAAAKLTYLANVSDATASETILSDMMAKIKDGDAAGGIAIGVKYYKDASAKITTFTPPAAWKAHHAALIKLTNDLEQTMTKLGSLLDTNDQTAATSTLNDAQREIGDYAQLQNDMLNDHKPSL